MQPSSLDLTSEFPSDRFPQTLATLAEGVANGVAPGFVAGLFQVSQPYQFYISAVGSRRVEPSVLPMLSDTLFDIASVTKVFATATLAAVLVERGWISWETPVCALIPEYAHPRVELRHLLSHTAGYVWWEPLYQKIRERFAPKPLWKIPISERQRVMRELVMGVAPQAQPGEKTEYSDIGEMVLGFALEEAIQMPLDRAVREFVWAPMGIRRAHYRPTIERASNMNESVAATERSPWHGAILQGQVHDENCWAMGGVSAHAGVFAPAFDLLLFSRALLTGFVSQSVLRTMWSRVGEPSGCERALGWDTVSLNGASSAGRYFSPRAVGHLGFTGCSLWIDPDAGIAAVLMSNRVHLTRENIKIRAFRPAFHDALRLDLARREP